jgi:signal transduction histidine kinase
MISSFDPLHEPTAPAGQPAERPNLSVPPPAADQIGGNVAHELNNVLTIVRGYADRLLFKHGENPALRPELKLISDNARRAGNVVRDASQVGRIP